MMAGASLADKVSTPQSYVAPAIGQTRYRVAVVDLGIKTMTLNRFAEHGMEAVVLPSTATIDDLVEATPDGVFFSNGPGDPATADHQVPPGVEPDAAAVVIDADLSILAAEPARYSAYVAGVRAEYGHVDDAAWRRGRADVLRRLEHPVGVGRPVQREHLVDDGDDAARLDRRPHLGEHARDDRRLLVRRPRPQRRRVDRCALGQQRTEVELLLPRMAVA